MSKKELPWHQGASRLPATFQAPLRGWRPYCSLDRVESCFLWALGPGVQPLAMEGSVALSPSFVTQAGKTEQERQLLGRSPGLHPRPRALSRRNRSPPSGQLGRPSALSCTRGQVTWYLCFLSFRTLGGRDGETSSVPQTPPQTWKPRQGNRAGSWPSWQQLLGSLPSWSLLQPVTPLAS